MACASAAALYQLSYTLGAGQFVAFILTREWNETWSGFHRHHWSICKAALARKAYKPKLSFSCMVYPIVPGSL